MNSTVDNIRNGGLDFIMMAVAHAKYGQVTTLDAWKFEGRLHHNLDVPNYDEPQGEAIPWCTHKLESKRRHFFSLKNWYGHGRTGCTIAVGPAHMHTHTHTHTGQEKEVES